jgi:hypothetical protein
LLLLYDQGGTSYGLGIRNAQTIMYAPADPIGGALVFGHMSGTPNYGGVFTERMRVDHDGKVIIGTIPANKTANYLLTVNGIIGATEVMVSNTLWSDYVFRPDYRLRPLSEVNAYIQAHHHLPDIPSEAEVKEKGVSVGEMQAMLLAKIEELTLHMIEQERQNHELRDRVAELETRAGAARPEE